MQTSGPQVLPPTLAQGYAGRVGRCIRTRSIRSFCNVTKWQTFGNYILDSLTSRSYRWRRQAALAMLLAGFVYPSIGFGFDPTMTLTGGEKGPQVSHMPSAGAGASPTSRGSPTDSSAARTVAKLRSLNSLCEALCKTQTSTTVLSRGLKCTFQFALWKARHSWSAKFWDSLSFCTYSSATTDGHSDNFSISRGTLCHSIVLQDAAAFNCSYWSFASAVSLSSSATRRSDSIWASPLATMVRRMQTYSITRPIPISASADVIHIRSFSECGVANSYAISTIMPARMISVARPDHRSRLPNLSWASFFFWSKSEGPFADIIRRSKRRLIVFLAVAAVALALAAIFGEVGFVR